MDYAKQVFERMKLQQICHFLMYGAEDFIKENQSYEEKLKCKSDPVYRRLEELCPNEEDLDTVVAELSQALITYEEVYMEIGMKAGARLIFQLLHKDDRIRSESKKGE